MDNRQMQPGMMPPAAPPEEDKDAQLYDYLRSKFDPNTDGYKQRQEQERQVAEQRQQQSAQMNKQANIQDMIGGMLEAANSTTINGERVTQPGMGTRYSERAKGLRSQSQGLMDMGHKDDLARKESEDKGLYSYLKQKQDDSHYNDSLDEKKREYDLKVADAKTNKADKTATKATDAQNRSKEKTVGLLTSMRGDPAVQQAEKDVYAAKKARTMAEKFKNPNRAMVSLLISDVAKIANGGQPTQHELDVLTPDTLAGKFSGWMEKLNNEPTPANATAFIQQYLAYANALSEDAKGQIINRYGRILDSNKNELGDDNYNTLKSTWVDRFTNEDSQNGIKKIKTVDDLPDKVKR